MKFREFKVCSGKKVLAGKNSEQNEHLMREFLETGRVILHTASPGSPFCIFLEEPDSKDIREAAIICAKYSKEWKTKKSDMKVHVFRGSDAFKESSMKEGEFGVKNFKSVILNKQEIEEYNAS